MEETRRTYSKLDLESQAKVDDANCSSVGGECNLGNFVERRLVWRSSGHHTNPRRGVERTQKSGLELTELLIVNELEETRTCGGCADTKVAGN